MCGVGRYTWGSGDNLRDSAPSFYLPHRPCFSLLANGDCTCDWLLPTLNSGKLVEEEVNLSRNLQRKDWRGRESWGVGGRGRKRKRKPTKAHSREERKVSSKKSTPKESCIFFKSMLHNFHSLHLWESLSRFTATTKPVSSPWFSLIRYYSLLFLMGRTHLWLFNLSFVLAFSFLLRCTVSYLQDNICDDLPNV